MNHKVTMHFLAGCARTGKIVVYLGQAPAKEMVVTVDDVAYEIMRIFIDTADEFEDIYTSYKSKTERIQTNVSCYVREWR